MTESPATVVLVHGLWMNGWVFALEGRWLAGEGFRVRTFSYPSVSSGLAGNSRRLAGFIAGLDGDGVHLVGHSLGGLVILEMLARQPDPRIRRAVLMGSPCAGSHSADMLLARPGLAPLVGRSVRDWLREPHPPLPPGVDIGTIAGTRSFGLGRVIPGLPRPNDGVVAVAETRLPAARDAIVLPIAHSEMLVSRDCAAQVAAFLKTGGFDHG